MASTTAEKIRQYRGPVLFERGYRPFFLGAGLFAFIIMPIWAWVMAGPGEIPGVLSDREWHVHEFLFGYVSAVLCGFLLTAIPNWTGRLPVLGLPLFLLWALWILGRVSLLIETQQPWIIALIDSSFLVSLSLLAWREVLAGKNYRNLPVCIMISIFALANIGFHYCFIYEIDAQILERAALSVIFMLLALVGGRITPSFTLNWMEKHDLSPLPVSFNRFDQLVLVVSFAAMVIWTVVPDHWVTGYGLAVMGVLHIVRISRWRGLSVLKEPLLFVLHLGQIWLPIWALLTATSILVPDLLSGSDAIHALTAGAIATMTLAVMIRACLGHSGRPITGGAGTIMIFASVSTSAILRIFVDYLPLEYETIMLSSAGLWCLAYLMFVIQMAPVVMTRKLAG